MENALIEIARPIISGLITGAFSAGAIWGIVSTKIKYLQKDVDSAHDRLNHHETIFHNRRNTDK